MTSYPVHGRCPIGARVLKTASGPGLLALLAACGGVNITADTNIGPPVPPSPPWIVSEPISSLGVVSAPGSVSVNGVRYDTSASSVTMNGRAAFPANLRAGHVVGLQGHVEEDGVLGTAHRIDCQAAVVGPVEAVDAAHQRVIVLGQTVVSNADTAYDSSFASGDLDSLEIGSRLQISGLLDANGQIVATRIEPAEANDALQVTGRVAGLDLANRLFTLDRLTIDYSGTLVIDLPGGMPAEGDAIVVRGSLASGLLIAQAMTGLPDPGFGTPDRRVHASGWVSRLTAANEFQLNGQSVSTSSATVFVNGSAADLGSNVLVTIDGRVSSDGQRVRARSVIFGRLPASAVGRSYALSDFDEVAVSGGFRTQITGSSAFVVELAADPGLADRLDVAQHGPLLEVGMLPGAPYQIDALAARIGLPLLQRLTVIELSRADLSNFTQPSLDLNLGGLSMLRGHSLAIDRLMATVFGGSLLDLGGVQPIQDAVVDISGASNVTLNLAPGSTLTGSVTGASSLQYYGTNVTVDVTTSGMSTVRRIGASRG
jgi:hypothetical protein